MALLPCHDDRGCDASCCMALAVWDIWSFSKLIKIFPGILEKCNAGTLTISGARTHFVILPKNEPFVGMIDSVISPAEFLSLTDRLESRMKSGDEETRCVFLDGTRRCKVYEHRPHVCQSFGVVPEMPCPKARPVQFAA